MVNRRREIIYSSEENCDESTKLQLPNLLRDIDRVWLTYPNVLTSLYARFMCRCTELYFFFFLCIRSLQPRFIWRSKTNKTWTVRDINNSSLLFLYLNKYLFVYRLYLFFKLIVIFIIHSHRVNASITKLKNSRYNTLKTRKLNLSA